MCGELLGVSNLLQFTRGSPVKDRIAHGRTNAHRSEPPEVRWHRTMKIAIDRAPQLSPVSLESSPVKAKLRLVRTVSASSVVEGEPKLISMSPNACLNSIR